MKKSLQIANNTSGSGISIIYKKLKKLNTKKLFNRQVNWMAFQRSIDS